MSITQERLYSVILAGQAIESHYMDMIRELTAISFEARAGKITATEYFEELDKIILMPKLPIYQQSMLLMMEHSKYNTTHRMNESERKRKERHRRLRGAKEHFANTMSHEEQLAAAIAAGDEYDSLSPSLRATAVPNDILALVARPAPKPTYDVESDPHYIEFVHQQKERDRAALFTVPTPDSPPDSPPDSSPDDDNEIFPQTISDPYIQRQRDLLIQSSPAQSPVSAPDDQIDELPDDSPI